MVSLADGTHETVGTMGQWGVMKLTPSAPEPTPLVPIRPRELRVPCNEDRMNAIIFDLDAERSRGRPRDPEPTPDLSDLNWRLSQRGNPYAVVNEAFHIVLFRRAGAWAFRIEDLDTGQAWFSERRYETEDAARSDALLAVGQLQGKEPTRPPARKP